MLQHQPHKKSGIATMNKPADFKWPDSGSKNGEAATVDRDKRCETNADLAKWRRLAMEEPACYLAGTQREPDLYGPLPLD